jgi:hypothetical protein
MAAGVILPEAVADLGGFFDLGEGNLADGGKNQGAVMCKDGKGVDSGVTSPND